MQDFDGTRLSVITSPSWAKRAAVHPMFVNPEVVQEDAEQPVEIDSATVRAQQAIAKGQLQEEIATLREELASLKQDFYTFKQQFD